MTHAGPWTRGSRLTNQVGLTHVTVLVWEVREVSPTMTGPALLANSVCCTGTLCQNLVLRAELFLSIL